MIRNKNIIYGNRGIGLEEDLNRTNEYYLIHNIASIYKKPTPITIAKVDYKINIIKEAYFKTPSTTDYNGIYKGKYIDFEAKETNLNNFPISNIHSHQIKHLETIKNMGGISFIIVRFNRLNEVYLLFTNQLLEFIEKNKRKSIPLEYFKTNGYLINYKYNPRLDYLDIIDNMEDKNEKI
ncbi:MAG: Holliday junction resolvase RecU [Bacilli bacterium]|nr:Holliday junction resolvase RecU [Bacilli bacterium]MDD4733424.1 Holliday junction resolvase RecU [Bacilli bacterium]